MQLKDTVKNWVAKALWNLSPSFSVGYTMIGGRSLTILSGQNSSYSNKIFYTASNILVRKMIEAPITVNKKKSTTNRKVDKFYSKSISNEQRAYLKAQALQEQDNHELNILFDNPNTYQVGIELFEDFWHQYNFGDGFLFFEPIGEASRNKKPFAIHSLSRDRVTVNRSNDKFNNVLNYTYSCQNGEQITIPKEYILHLKHWNPNHSELKGLGVDFITSIDVSLNAANNEAQGAAFANGGRGTFVSGKSEVTNEGEVVDKLTVPQIEAIKSTIERDVTGARNNRKMTFTNGEIVVTPYGDTLAEMEMTETEKSQWKNVFAIFGIPWVLSPVGSDAAENSIKIGYKSLVTNLVISELRKFDQKLTKIIQQWWPEIVCVHDLTEFSELAPDLELMMKVYGKPSLTENERRSIFGYDELKGDEGKAILVASGLTNLRDIISNEFDDLTGNEDI